LPGYHAQVREVARLRPELKVVCITQNSVRDDRMTVRCNVPNDLLPVYYSAADLLLFPSRYESFGYTPLEAMACGLPVVSTRTGIFEDLDDDRAGEVLVSPDPDGLVKAVDRVLRGDYEPRAVVSERFSLDRFAEQYRSVARGVVAEHANGSSKKTHLDASDW
jgi:mannosyltransferase